MPPSFRTIYLTAFEYECVPLLKFGLSNNHYRRLEELERSWNTRFDLIFEIDCSTTALDAGEIERAFRRDVPMAGVLFGYKPQGWTEVFVRTPEAEAAAIQNLRKLARGSLVPAPIDRFN